MGRDAGEGGDRGRVVRDRRRHGLEPDGAAPARRSSRGRPRARPGRSTWWIVCFLVSEPSLVTVSRSGVAESTHRVHIAVARADGTLVAACGDPDRLTTMRSCAKPYQVEPLLASGGFDALGLDEEVLAVACASHMGQDIHVAAVERGLAACGLTAAALDNHRGTPEERLRHNCSGNHLGFLALSVHRGWETAGYRYEGHPSQEAARTEVAGRAGVDAGTMETCVDGCGVLAFVLPLQTMAAMRAHPELVRGDGDLDTELMRAVPGAVSKGGAEALACIGLADESLGVAVRVEDGAYRALDPVVVETLRQLLGWERTPAPLEQFAEPVIANMVGDPVVRVSARVALAT